MAERWVWIAPNGQVQILNYDLHKSSFGSTTINIPGKLIVDIVDGQTWVYIHESLFDKLPDKLEERK